MLTNFVPECFLKSAYNFLVRLLLLICFYQVHYFKNDLAYSPAYIIIKNYGLAFALLLPNIFCTPIMANLLPLFFTFISVLLVVKLIMFIYYKTSNWDFVTFIYFSNKHITLTEDSKRETIKRIQNVLSLAIFFTLLLWAVFIFIIPR